MNDAIQNMRVDYARGGLREGDLDPDPFVQFGRWFEDARGAGIVEPNAMTLATAGADGWPSARVVLLKGFDPQGFVFFTNYESAKARDLAANPRVALVFYWDKLERSVRITGTASKVDRAETEAYFRLRPYKSQLGAWVSRQSSEAASREELEARFAALARQYPEGAAVPCPPFWGGYRVAVGGDGGIEFWQGQRSRLHDRLRYTLQADGSWHIARLNP